MNIKYIGLFVLCLSLVNPVKAEWNNENCTSRGGTIVNVNSRSFCQSGRAMNWWSANIWCSKHGGHLPSYADLCPGAANSVCGTRRWPDNIWVKETYIDPGSHAIRPYHVYGNGGGVTLATVTDSRNVVCEQ